jgi:hypothetical protein
VLIYKCDDCGEVKECTEVTINGLVYDFCNDCKRKLDKKLKGKGRYKNQDSINIWYPYVPHYPVWDSPKISPWYSGTVYADSYDTVVDFCGSEQTTDGVWNHFLGGGGGS